jgi:hypothetical protein
MSKSKRDRKLRPIVDFVLQAYDTKFMKFQVDIVLSAISQVKIENESELESTAAVQNYFLRTLERDIDDESDEGLSKSLVKYAREQIKKAQARIDRIYSSPL